jgi:hypothetical protein
VTSAKRAHRHPPAGWDAPRENLADPEGGWLCSQIDGHLSAFGPTREAAVAEAWRIHKLRDLHRTAAGLCKRALGTPGRRRGMGLVICTVHRTRPPDAEPGHWASIDAVFGADFAVIKGIADARADGDLGFFDELPECSICEVLCEVVREDDERDEQGRTTYRGHDYLEIVKLNGKPAIEVWHP